jgi:hypothetical protein
MRRRSAWRKNSRTAYTPAAKSQRGLMSSGWRGLRQRTRTRDAVARRRCTLTMKRRMRLWLPSAFADRSRGSEGHKLQLQRVRPHTWKERLLGGAYSNTGYAEYQLGLAIRVISTIVGFFRGFGERGAKFNGRESSNCYAAAYRTRCFRRSKLARPNICRLSSFSRCT